MVLGYFGVQYNLLVYDRYDNMLVNIDKEFEAKLEPDRMWDWECGIVKLEETPRYFNLHKKDLTGYCPELDKYFEGRWSPRELKFVASSVRNAEVTSVKYLALCHSDHFYTMEDLRKVFEILPVTESLAMSALALPVDMDLEQWQTVVDRVSGLE